MYLRRKLPLIATALAFLFVTGYAQSAAPAPAPQASLAAPALSASADLRPALSQVQTTTANLNIDRWKTSHGVRMQTQQDVDSIQQDLTQTLPSLLAPADAAPDSVPPSFTVYRNVDALYDVLLRVSSVADFAAPREEAEAISDCLQQLAAARLRLGDSILQVSQRHETQIQQFRSAVKVARTEAAAPPRETVIDDGPVHSTSRRRRVLKKEVHAKHLAKPAPGTPKS